MTIDPNGPVMKALTDMYNDKRETILTAPIVEPQGKIARLQGRVVYFGNEPARVIKKEDNA